MRPSPSATARRRRPSSSPSTASTRSAASSTSSSPCSSRRACSWATSASSAAACRTCSAAWNPICAFSRRRARTWSPGCPRCACSSRPPRSSVAIPRPSASASSASSQMRACVSRISTARSPCSPMLRVMPAMRARRQTPRPDASAPSCAMRRHGPTARRSRMRSSRIRSATPRSRIVCMPDASPRSRRCSEPALQRSMPALPIRSAPREASRPLGRARSRSRAPFPRSRTALPPRGSATPRPAISFPPQRRRSPRCARSMPRWRPRARLPRRLPRGTIAAMSCAVSATSSISNPPSSRSLSACSGTISPPSWSATGTPRASWRHPPHRSEM